MSLLHFVPVSLLLQKCSFFTDIIRIKVAEEKLPSLNVSGCRAFSSRLRCELIQVATEATATVDIQTTGIKEEDLEDGVVHQLVVVAVAGINLVATALRDTVNYLILSIA